MKIEIDTTLPKIAVEKFGFKRQCLKLREEIFELEEELFKLGDALERGGATDRINANLVNEVADIMIVAASIAISRTSVDDFNACINKKLQKFKEVYFKDEK